MALNKKWSACGVDVKKKITYYKYGECKIRWCQHSLKKTHSLNCKTSCTYCFAILIDGIGILYTPTNLTSLSLKSQGESLDIEFTDYPKCVCYYLEYAVL